MPSADARKGAQKALADVLAKIDKKHPTYGPLLWAAIAQDSRGLWLAMAGQHPNWKTYPWGELHVDVRASLDLALTLAAVFFSHVGVDLRGAK